MSEGTRYSEDRILVRGLRRLPGESREEFKRNVLKLRRQFEKFNLDASELCQWLMGFRPGGKRGDESTRPFWEFFLEKNKDDNIRRVAFDVVAGWSDENSLKGYSFPDTLLESIRTVRDLPLTPTAENLFERLRKYEDGHRTVLLKASAEWIDARYWSGIQKQKPQYDAWQKEKDDWEAKHPKLTEDVRRKFNDIFKAMGVREKRPRICGWERLKGLKDDCEYAGERLGNKNHAPLCVKYKKFFDEYKKNPQDGNSFKKFFVENALKHLKNKKTRKSLSMKEQLQQKWFPDAWKAYLNAIEVNESSILRQYNCRLPHCTDFSGDCEFNKHTELCNLYRGKLSDHPDIQPLEKLYRDWRRDYLSGPKKPSFRYPSTRDLPMPKIFGAGFYKADFENSVLELRLEGMPNGEFLSFGFKPWPKDYSPQPGETKVTSVHINFIGTRARAGFRFGTQHEASRFTVSQDDIDELRSHVYPRQAQDNEFLNEARKRLLESFQGDAEQSLRILAVDIGETGACAALFEGKTFTSPHPLKINKLDELYDFDRPPKNKQKSDDENEKCKRKGA